MKHISKPGVIVPLVCATGLTLAALAAAIFGARATPAEPVPDQKAAETCPNKDGQKTENCARQFPFYTP